MLTPLYLIASNLAPPAARIALRRRIARGKEDPARVAERRGRASLPRPEGRLIWIHAASVGESQAALPLIDALLATDPALHVLMTTGTRTSAALMAERLPPRAIHQYVPVDCAPWVRRFLHHWKPDLAIWIESELWPALVAAANRRKIPMLLINARMTERSFRRWQRLPGIIRPLLHAFSEVLAQTDTDADRFRKLGAIVVETMGNLKSAADPLPADQSKLLSLRAAIGPRPAWLAASTHPGEEEQVAEAHRRLIARRPDLLLILVPRHPERGRAIADMLGAAGFATAERSKGHSILPQTQIYIADTLGELGLFYRLADLVFMGGSLVPHGGQNLLEPARLDSAILFGPHMENFRVIAQGMIRAGGARHVKDAAALTAALDELLDDPVARARMAKAARETAAAEKAVLRPPLAAIARLLPTLAKGNGRAGA